MGLPERLVVGSPPRTLRSVPPSVSVWWDHAGPAVLGHTLWETWGGDLVGGFSCQSLSSSKALWSMRSCGHTFVDLPLWRLGGRVALWRRVGPA